MPRDEVDGWLLLRGDAVPERWRERATALSLIPLLPGEAAEILADGATLPGVGPEKEPLLRMVADGLDQADIAARLGVSVRTVERRLASLRRRLGVGSTSELARLLARRGF